MSRMNNLWKTLAAYTGLLLILIPFIPLDTVTLSVPALGYIFLLGIFRPRLGLLLFLFTRPILDHFTGKEVLSFASYEMNPASLWGVAILVVTAWTIYKCRDAFPRLPLLRPWGIFLAVAAITLPLSIHTTAGIYEITRMATIFALFTLGYLTIGANKHLTDQIKVIIFSMIIPAALAYYQFFTATGLTLPLEHIYNRIYGTFAHPNLFAFYLIIPLVLSLVIVVIKNKKEVATYMFAVLAAIFSALLVLTYTRGAWIAFMSAMFIVGAIRYRKILVVMAAALALLYVAVPTVQERAARLVHPDPYGSIVWRFDLWEDGLGYTLNRPFLGHGAGTARDVILKHRGEEKGSPDPHNDYLKIMLEFGFIGLAAYLYLLVSVLVLLWKTYQAENRPNFKDLYLAIFALSAAIFIMSFGDNIFRNTALQWTLWSLIGGALALRKTRLSANKPRE